MLAVEVAKTEPDGIQVHPRVRNGKIIIKPVLLNKKDSFILKVLVSQFSNDKITFGGRIIGVKEIKEFSEKKSSMFIIICGMILMLISGIFFVLELFGFLFPFLTFFFGYMLTAIGISRFKGFRNIVIRMFQ